MTVTPGLLETGPARMTGRRAEATIRYAAVRSGLQRLLECANQKIG